MDVVTLLLVFVAALLFIPSRLVVEPLGAAGTPAQLIGMVALVWWVSSRLSSVTDVVGKQPFRLLAFAYCSTILASYAAGMLRLIPAVEVRAADRGLLSTAAWVGVLLLACDGIVSRQRLERLLVVLTWGGAILATVGVLQFFVGFDVAEYVWIPGLAENSDFDTLRSRSGFNRPSGTALHPIEFSVTLAVILPVALHFAIARTDRLSPSRWIPPALIALALPLSVSRSALLGLVVGTLVLYPAQRRAGRRLILASAVVLLMLMYVAVPGLLGTIRNLFTGFSRDGSIQSRTDSYSVAMEFFAQRPIFGRGYSTFLPEYRILDNQYLHQLIDTGLVGLIAMVALLSAGYFLARGVRRRTTDPSAAGLAQALAAASAVSLVSFATFDALFFPMTAGVAFLVLGCVGALWRLEAYDETGSLRPLTNRQWQTAQERG